jgi:hypothetical protein
MARTKIPFSIMQVGFHYGSPCASARYLWVKVHNAKFLKEEEEEEEIRPTV